MVREPIPTMLAAPILRIEMAMLHSMLSENWPMQGRQFSTYL